jgi:hypothetical protein
MFFFIGGIQPRTVRIDRAPRACPRCGRSSLFRERTDHYLSLFFIPLFPVKKGRPVLRCESCESRFEENGTPLFPGVGPVFGRCPQCGRPVQDDFRLCPYCGRSL